MAVPASECLIITPLWYTAVVRVGDLITCTCAAAINETAMGCVDNKLEERGWVGGLVQALNDGPPPHSNLPPLIAHLCT